MRRIVFSEDIALADLDILDIGNTIQLAGAIWAGNGDVMITPFPGQDLSTGEMKELKLSLRDWDKVLYQSDVLDIQGPNKAILRKSQRAIDQHVAWKVFKRDDYKCRYCGKEGPLTVDHVILWENEGATVEDNLISACSKCNKTRGRMEYDVWLQSPAYEKVSKDLQQTEHWSNLQIIGQMDYLKSIKSKPRSR